MLGEKGKLYSIYVISPSAASFWNTTFAQIEEYLYLEMLMEKSERKKSTWRRRRITDCKDTVVRPMRFLFRKYGS
jgi:hypothetical protein